MTRRRGLTAVGGVGAGALLLMAAVPSAAVASPGASTQPLRTLASAPAKGGSDSIAWLTRRILVLDARLASASAQVETLTLRHDRLVADQATAHTRLEAAKVAFTTAKANASAAKGAHSAADQALAPLAEAAKVARSANDEATKVAESAQQRWDQATSAAGEAADQRAKASSAASKVAKKGSDKEVEQAVAAWRMLAVADRAANARLVLADDDLTQASIALEATQTTLTQADSAAQEATAVRDGAVAAHTAADATYAAAKAERTAARDGLAHLDEQLPTTTEALAAAKDSQATLTAERARLQAKLDEAAAHQLTPSASPSQAALATHAAATSSVTPALLFSTDASPQAEASAAKGGVRGVQTVAPTADKVAEQKTTTTPTAAKTAETTKTAKAPAQKTTKTAKTADQKPTKGEKWRESGTVVKVVDGDTVDLDIDGVIQRVRISSIQAPEKKWCGGTQATKALSEVLPEGTKVRLASKKAASGNAPTGVWRLKRTVHVEVNGKWTDIAPDLLARGMVFPFPFIGEDIHNDEYIELARTASEAGLGVYDPQLCGKSGNSENRVRLEVVADGPGPNPARSEFVLIFNGGTAAIDLAGWMVQDSSPLNAFFFPKGATLAPDDYVVVASGPGERGVAPDGSKDDRYFYTGGDSRWNDHDADIAFLFDSAGKGETGNLASWLIVTPES